MLRSLVLPLTTGLALSLAGLASPAAAQQYRGMPAGWPNYAAGYPAAPVNMAGYAAPLSVYAARPAYPTSAAYYAPTAGMAPTYGARTAYAAPTTAYYAPNAITAYSPTTAYAPGTSYAYSPSTVGNSAFANRAYYGQAGSINLPSQLYRSYYAQAPVMYYRPVTAYQPVAGTTCLQPAAVATTCQQPATTCLQPVQSTGCGSRWPILNWLHDNLCWWNRPRCTTNYCGAPSSSCGTPYYPLVPAPTTTTPPVILQPGVTAPSSTIPVVPAPSIRTPIITTPTVPPPPTRPSAIVPGTTVPGTTVPGVSAPADTRPQLNPGGLPSTGGGFNPGTTSPSIPSTPGTGASPSIPPSTGAPGTSPSIPRTEYFPPSEDPYRGSSFGPSRFGNEPAPSGSPSRFGEPSGEAQPNNSLRFAPPGNTIPDGVRVVPDPERAGEAPVNRAPQLLDPHDRSAAAARLDRWAVVPAVWPTKRASHAAAARVIEAQPSRNLNERTDFATTSSHVPSRPGLTTVERTAVTESWDDSGWSSGR